METVRERTRSGHADFAIECHWRYDVRDVITPGQSTGARASPCGWRIRCRRRTSKAMARVTQAINVPVCTGENLYARQGFRELIELQACDVVHIDIPKSGGLLESKKIPIWRRCTTSGRRPQSGQPAGNHCSCPCRAAMRDIPHSRTGQVHRLVAGPRRPRRAILEERVFHDPGQARLWRRNEPGRRQGASRARRNMVGLATC